jgi:hypothetical protein
MAKYNPTPRGVTFWPNGDTSIPHFIFLVDVPNKWHQGKTANGEQPAFSAGTFDSGSGTVAFIANFPFDDSEPSTDPGTDFITITVPVYAHTSGGSINAWHVKGNADSGVKKHGQIASSTPIVL